MPAGIRAIILSVCLCGFMAACGTAPAGRGSEQLYAVVLQTGRQCLPAPEGWRATWIVSPEALGKMRAKCRSNFIPAVPEAGSGVDFDRFGVLAVEMGQKTTAGYGFDRESVTARLEGRMVTVCLAYSRPATGAITAQVLTNPWMLIQLPLGDYDGIRVVDPEGRLLVQLDEVTF